MVHPGTPWYTLVHPSTPYFLILFSCGEIGTHGELNKSSSNPDLVHNRFGKQSIQNQSVDEDDEGDDKSLIQVFAHDPKKRFVIPLQNDLTVLVKLDGHLVCDYSGIQAVVANSLQL